MKRICHTRLLAFLLATMTFPLFAYERLQGPTQVTYWDRTKTYDGYTLFGAQGTTYLLDMEGRVAHTWPVGVNPRLLDNGNVLDASSGAIGGFPGLREVDWSGSTVWSHAEARTNYFPHHDFLRIYNPKLGTNTTLYIANKAISSNQCLAAGCNPASSAYSNVTVDAVIEVDATGNVIWEWCFFDHGIQDYSASKTNYVGSGKNISNYPGKINLNLPGRPLTSDWLHCTSLDFNTNLDQIVISAEGGEFYVIDHGSTFLPGNPAGSVALAASTNGDFIYRFGDPARYTAGNPPSVNLNWTTSTTGNKQIGGVSQAAWIPAGVPGAGRFLVFNNGQDLFETTPQSYIFEVNGYFNSGATNTGAYVNPPSAGYTSLQPPGHDTDKRAKNISKQVVAMFYSMANQAFFSPIGGSAQRLPNGNLLVCSASEGHLFEVTSSGEAVWEYENPVTTNGIATYKRDTWPLWNPVYRAMRVSAAHPALAGRALASSATITGETPSYIAAPTVSGTALSPAAPLPGSPAWVTASVTNRSGSATAKLVYSAGGATNNATLYDDGANQDGAAGDGRYGAQIPAYAAGTLVRYWITASNDFDFAASDPSTAPASAYSYTVQAAASNTAPTLDALSDRTVNPGYTLTATAAAHDSDTPAQTLTFSLVSPPANAAIGATNGVITFTPSYAQYGTTNRFTVVVTDSGTPALSATNAFSVLVVANTAPAFAAQPLRVLTAGETLVLTNRASDPEVPPQTLSYFLVTAPAGAALDASTGVLTWPTSDADIGTTNAFMMVAADNGVPSLIGVSTFSVAVAAPVPATASYDLVLGRPTASSITVSMLSSNALQCYVEYGVTPGVYIAQTAAATNSPGLPLEFELSGLQADTAYTYRLRYRAPGAPAYSAGAACAFHTQRAPGSGFTFAIQGDSHPERVNTMFQSNLYARTLQTAAADRPDFYLTIGDDFSVDQIATNLISQARVTERYTLQRPYLGLIAQSAPLFLVNGNHEQAAQYLLDGTPSNIAVWAQNARNTFYPQPAPDGFYTGNTNAVPYIGLLRNYYAWTWGDALFVTIDPYWGSPTCPDNNYWTGVKRTNMWDVTHGDAQYQWLKQTLEQSTAKYKFVFAHHVMGTGRGGVELAGQYEWGGKNNNGSWGFTANRPSWPLPIHPLMATNHVTAFFQGHDHLFARQTLDGVTYLTLPNPADPTYTLWNADAFTNSVYVTNNTGYVRIGVGASAAKVDYVRTYLPADEGAGKTNGMVGYSFTLAPYIASNSVVAAGAVLTQLVSGLSFTEGPAADAAGNVYFSDIPSDTVYRWSVSSQLSVFRSNSSGANGLAFDRYGNLLACEGDAGQLTSTSPLTNVTALAGTYGGLRFNEPNDLWVDPKGGIYFTDPIYFGHANVQGGEHLYYLKADRSAVVRVASDLIRPNGLVGTPDGQALYVADWGAGTVYRYSLLADGALSNKTAFASVTCDGMTIDAAGRLYLTESAIRVFSAAGAELEQIGVPARPTNLAFGGSDRKTLFITADNGSLYALRMNSQGVPLVFATNTPPAIASVGTVPASPAAGQPTWVTAAVTDDTAVAGVTLFYNTGASISVTNTVFSETMATNPVKPWTGAGCDNPWTVSFSGGNPFEQRAGSNFGAGNTNGLEFKSGTANLSDSMVTLARTIDARGSSAALSFAVWADGMSGAAGWAMQLNAGTGFATRVSELSGTSHAWQTTAYSLAPGELVSNLLVRFQFRGGSTSNRIDLDQILLKVVATTGGWASAAMLDDGLHGDGAAGDGVYGAQIPAQTLGTTVSYYVTAADGYGSSATNPPAGAAGASSFVVGTGASAPSYDVLLGRPTDRSVAASVMASADLEAYVQYGTQPGVYAAQTASTNLLAGVPGAITLASLAADAQYYYRLRYRQAGEPSFSAGAEGSFHTQRALGSDFTFVIEADPHWRDPNATISPLLWRAALINMLADRPDFLIDLGDTFMTEKLGVTNYAVAAQLCREVRTNLFGGVGHSLPLFLVNGNHEAELGWLKSPSQPQNNIAVWATQARQYFYPCPAPGAFYSSNTNVDPYMQAARDDHYAFNWGDALFVVLDPYWNTTPKPNPATCWNWTLGTNQYQWLQQTLSQSTATYKFVFIHNLVGGSFDGAGRGGIELSSYFEWGGYNTNGTWGFTSNRPGWAMPIQDLLLTNGVNAVFHGHDHLFVKQDLDANGDGTPELIYQECPQPSATNYNTTVTAAGYGYTNGVIQGNSGHLRVHVTSAKATVEYVRAYLPESEGLGKTNGMVTYSYTIAGAAPERTNWSLPDTGQTGSYTPTFGEDSDYALNPPSYTDDGDGTVVDNVTGLMWQKADSGELTFESATNYPSTLALGGFSDWRLPTAHELYGILNLSLANPALNTNVFTASAAEYWWSSDRQSGNASNIWVSNSGGGIGPHPKGETLSAGGTKRFHTRCVRGVAVTGHRFVKNADGTASDLDTGLVWQQAPLATVTNWEGALRYAEGLSLAGSSDWRLPNIKELQSINDESLIRPSVDTNLFPGTGQTARFWSSTTRCNGTNTAWHVDFTYGIATYDVKQTNYWVRCVRQGLSASGTTNSVATPGPSDAVWVTSRIGTVTNLAQVALVYDAGGGAVSVAMVDNGLHGDGAAGDGVYGALIPAFPAGTTVRYYVAAADAVGRTTTDPAGVPASRYGYTVAGVAPSVAFTPKYVRIPGGSYVMGDSFNYVDPGHPSDEIPLHTVVISAFYMSTTPLTCREYVDYLNAAATQGLVEVRSGLIYAVGGTNAFCDTTGAYPYSAVVWTNGFFSVRSGRDLHPITGIRWFGAAAYCNWLSVRDGYGLCYDLATGACNLSTNGYRLPTEAEWEYAARGGQTSPYRMFPWGDDTNVDGRLANWEGSGDPWEAADYPRTTPVGFYSGALRLKADYAWPATNATYQTRDGSNGFGLTDMSGNVWQWLNDWYKTDYYTNCLTGNIVTNPPGPAVGSTMPDGQPCRGLRGGNWWNGGGQTYYGHGRVANRDPSYFRGPDPYTGLNDPNGPWFHVGFRVMRPERLTQTVGLFLNTTNVCPGYILMSPMHDTNTYLINNAGQYVHKWTSTYEPGRAAYLLENGHMFRAGMVRQGGPSTGGGEGGRIEEYDWAGNLVWSIDYYSPTYIHHHDFKVLPNGNVLLLVAEKKTLAEVIAAGFKTNLLDSSILTQGYMLPDCLVEVTPTRPTGGTVVWEWHLWDHMIQDADATKNNYGVVANHPELIDVNGTGIKIPQFWNHVNGIDYHAGFDQVMLSIRGNNELFVVDHGTTAAQAASHAGGRYNKGGDILYRWGDPQQYDRGTSGNRQLYQQHHTHWIAEGLPGAGNILIFNNGIGRGYSTVNEIAPPMDGAGAYSIAPGVAFGPSSPAWTYAASPTTNFYSSEISGCQRQPNGNTLICEGIKGNLFEVTSAGQIVWRYMCPVTSTILNQGDAIPIDPARPDQLMNAVFRVTRYPTNYVGLAGKDLTPRGTIETYAGAATDTTGLGLPDVWVRANFGSLSAVSATSDEDGDGLYDRTEYTLGFVATRADSDSDGIPDGWEKTYSRDPTYNGDATNRAANGYSYLQSYLADLTPTNPNSQLGFTHIGEAGGDIALTWIGGVNAWQNLECTTNLVTGLWTTVFTNAPPTPVTNTVLHTAPPRQLFYRLNAHR